MSVKKILMQISLTLWFPNDVYCCIIKVTWPEDILFKHVKTFLKKLKIFNIFLTLFHLIEYIVKLLFSLTLELTEIKFLWLVVKLLLVKFYDCDCSHAWTDLVV